MIFIVGIVTLLCDFLVHERIGVETIKDTSVVKKIKFTKHDSLICAK